MPVYYNYEPNDFINATVLDIGHIQEKILELNLSSATLLYISSGANGIVQIYFSGALSTEEQTILNNFVAAYTDQVIYTDTVCKISDIKTPGTNGGTFTQDVWTTRTLNVLEGNVGFATLSNNIITLAPGKYMINAKVPSCAVGSNQTRLRNLTDNEYYLGMNTYSTSDLMSTSDIQQYLNFDHSVELDVQHICSDTAADIGLGRATGYGINEIYTTVMIQQIIEQV